MQPDAEEKGCVENELQRRCVAKILTYITVAVLLGAMLVEAFVIYMERREQERLEAEAVSAQEAINELSAQAHSLADQVKELQEFQDNWEDFVIPCGQRALPENERGPVIKGRR